MKSKNVLVISLLMLLASCGGGGSSSGGGESNIVSNCISVTTEPSVTGFTRTIFTNTCNFQVNLTTVSARIESDPIPLGQNETHSSITASATTFIACRAPSVGINRGEFPNVELACTD